MKGMPCQTQKYNNFKLNIFEADVTHNLVYRDFDPEGTKRFLQNSDNIFLP